MAKKKYPCFGYEITIDEAAEFCCVSVASIRAQLTKLGGSMEAVVGMYDRRSGGVIDRMKKYYADDVEKKNKAVDDIMAALGMAEAEEENEVMPAEPEEAHVFSAEGAAATGIMLVPADVPEEAAEEMPALPRIMLAEADHSGEKKQLSILNGAIDAIEKLEEVNFVMECASVLRDDFLLKLKQMRVNEFEHLVDWKAIAGGERHA